MAMTDRFDLHAALEGTYDPYDCDAFLTAVDLVQRTLHDIDQTMGVRYGDEYRRQLAELLTRRDPAGTPSRGLEPGPHLRAVGKRR